MYLFSRAISLVGPPAESGAYAIDMRQHVADVTGRDIALWATVFGAPLGSMAFAMRVSGLADLQSVAAPLLADPAYHERIAAGQKFSGGPPVDNLAQPLLGELGEESPPVGSVATLTTATMAGGQYSKAIAWGIDVAQHVTAVSGVPAMFLVNSYGTFGDVAWISVVPDMATADTASEAVNSDADYLAKLEDVGELFQQGTGNRMLMTRIA